MGVKIYPLVVGNTLGSHEKFLKKIENRGAKIVQTEDGSDETIVFCPIVSRFETDIQAALSNISGKRKVILVAMHHTYDPNCTLPDDRRSYDTRVKLLVDCLFFEKRGLYKCQRNSNAKKKVYEQLGLRKLKTSIGSSTNRAGNAEPKKSSKRGCKCF